MAKEKGNEYAGSQIMILILAIVVFSAIAVVFYKDHKEKSSKEKHATAPVTTGAVVLFSSRIFKPLFAKKLHQ